MIRRISLDPVTRVEGQARVHVFLDDAGTVRRTALQIPELKGFESFCRGRAADEMPTLTAKVCGICPTAHHLASSKALDDLYGCAPPAGARKFRELLNAAFFFEDHLLHLFVLGGPDLLLAGLDTGGRGASLAEVVRVLGTDLGRSVLQARARARELQGWLSGSALYPNCSVAGGVSRALDGALRPQLEAAAAEALAFAHTTLELFQDRVLRTPSFRDSLSGQAFRQETHYLGTVDPLGRVAFYDGALRVVRPDGSELARFAAADFTAHLAERPVPSSYGKFLYLKQVGWRGLDDGPASGLYRVGPLARLNVATGMSTPLAQAEYERFYATVQEKPAHGLGAYYWARLVEVLHAAERMVELARDPELYGDALRSAPGSVRGRGVGACEAPRGTLIHAYRSDDEGLLTAVTLLVGTQNNYAAMCATVDRVARDLIRAGADDDTVLMGVETALRAYDPCFACTTHALSGGQRFVLQVHRPRGGTC